MFNQVLPRNLMLFAATALLLVADATAQPSYPLAPDDACGSLGTCQEVIDTFNVESWTDLVDDGFHTGSEPLATVRWYSGGEGNCSGGPLCTGQLAVDSTHCPNPDPESSRFCGVTDEFSNVLLSHAMGTDQAHYDALHSFAERLRHPSINDLQCWRFSVDGPGAYDDYTDLCDATDSVADASLRILGAYGIACAKQQAGLWTPDANDYCGDYVEQGEAIWGDAISGFGGDTHGEVKWLDLQTGPEYFLTNSYNTHICAPTGKETFRPDYYELQFLMDFAVYMAGIDPTVGVEMEAAVLDMLDDYVVSTGVNRIHRGRFGHFDDATDTFTCEHSGQCPAGCRWNPVAGECRSATDSGARCERCTETNCEVNCAGPCEPPFMDRTDTWRVIPALSGLYLVHPERVPPIHADDLFGYWWENYGDEAYAATAAKPFEIWSDSSEVVKEDEDSYKTLGMWIPLAAASDAAYTRDAVEHLVNVKYNSDDGQFFGAAYYGGYFSQFAQRAIGAATGLIDPVTYALSSNDFTVTITPTNPPPPVVLPRGGEVEFGITFDIGEGGPSSFEFWTEAVLPNGAVRSPLIGPQRVEITVPVTGTLFYDQQVPGNAPVGDYTYRVEAGTFPDATLGADNFTVEIEPGRIAAGPDEWQAFYAAGRPVEAGTVYDLRPSVNAEVAPDAVMLMATYPNPFDRSATIAFALPRSQAVRLVVYDMLGREVVVLVDAEREAGRHEVMLGTSMLSAGVYLVRLETDEEVRTQRITLLR